MRHRQISEPFLGPSNRIGPQLINPNGQGIYFPIAAEPRGQKAKGWKPVFSPSSNRERPEIDKTLECLLIISLRLHLLYYKNYLANCG